MMGFEAVCSATVLTTVERSEFVVTALQCSSEFGLADNEEQTLVGTFAHYSVRRNLAGYLVP